MRGASENIPLPKGKPTKENDKNRNHPDRTNKSISKSLTTRTWSKQERPRGVPSPVSCW